ncbi:MAG: hypothetical protein A2958_02225 [Candidatus Levybacteria bacterium RIFCSPLOWO2_01_FULL_38_13]|nr:MAG: hypothetical protein A2629_03855 [Candidatus Levybacteria bacterium RIFCSPHIGHO2_01_FULL_41_15]OGH35067.1 MAG: hypothetical protein A2958_02225 [Candidatus Levybacteria bacterium RIFCSPLOWO2_01_FULL_38_13]
MLKVSSPLKSYFNFEPKKFSHSAKTSRDKSFDPELRTEGLTIREKRSEFWKEFKRKTEKNKKLLKIKEEVKAFCLKFPCRKF